MNNYSTFIYFIYYINVHTTYVERWKVNVKVKQVFFCIKMAAYSYV